MEIFPEIGRGGSEIAIDGELGEVLDGGVERGSHESGDEDHGSARKKEERCEVYKGSL